MIAALAKASQVLKDPKYLQAAVKAADFILGNLRKENGELYHRYVKGEKAVDGFLDDYAFLAFGLIEIYEASFEEKYLQAASALTKAMVARFWDEKDGGFYFSAKKAETAVPRMKQVYDGAVPSGNSVALYNLLRMSRLMNETAYDGLASKILKVFSEEVKGAPHAHTFMLAGLDFAIGPTYNIVIVGDLHEKNTLDMLSALRKHYLPNLTVTLRQPGKAGLGYERLEGKATAYVCQNQTCKPPTNRIIKMLEMLNIQQEKAP
jgi:uncharacterized protein YyaL (SSP411 family)